MTEKAANPLRNAKHEAVLQHYFSDPARVGWRWYQRVYPNSTRRAAETGFSRLLKTAEFGARLAFLQKSAADHNVMDLNEVLVELSKLGRSNIQNVVVSGDDTSDVVEALEQMPAEHAATIQELTVETYVESSGEAAREVKRVKIKLHSKHAALAELRAHHEPSRHEHTGKDGGAMQHEVDDGSGMSERELGRRILFALERAARAPAQTKGRKLP
ncbi:MAG TPA: terminase small subunit [Dehalococcoidia bacterium]